MKDLTCISFSQPESL